MLRNVDTTSLSDDESILIQRYFNIVSTLVKAMSKQIGLVESTDF